MIHGQYCCGCVWFHPQQWPPPTCPVHGKFFADGHAPTLGRASGWEPLGLTSEEQFTQHLSRLMKETT